MGIIVESCRSHMVCCNTEDRGQITEPNLNVKKNFTFSEMEDEEYIENETEDINSTNKPIPDLNSLPVKINDLIMDHQESPFRYYKEMKTLGSGTYGTVKKVCLIKNPLTIRAMKIISKDNIRQGLDHTKLIDEIKILKKLDHPNIMKIYECFVDEHNFYIISDFCDQGDLLGKLEKLGKMNEIVVKFLMEQVLNAVAYLHSKKVLHGDIKLENILLYTATSQNKGRRFTSINIDINEIKELRRELNKNETLSKRSRNYVNDMLNYEIKLIDFGCSKYFVKKNKHRSLSGVIGSPLYCSPEVVDDLYDELSDEWSCGVLMYILLSGEAPFKGTSEEELFKEIKKCKYSFDLVEFNEVSSACKDLIRKLMEPKKSKRIKAHEALKHPFFTQLFNPIKSTIQKQDLNILRNLIRYKQPTSKFHESMYAFICNNYIDIDEEKHLRAVFRSIDRSDKNNLSKEDLRESFKEIKVNLSDEELNIIFKKIDSDQNHSIQYQEFLRAACDKKTLLSQENLKNAFLALCENEEREYITGDNIKRFIFHDLKLQEEVFDEYLEQFGMKRDDKMSFAQFCDILRNDKKLNIEKDKEEDKNIDNSTKNVSDESI